MIRLEVNLSTVSLVDRAGIIRVHLFGPRDKNAPCGLVRPGPSRPTLRRVATAPSFFAFSIVPWMTV
jgi:hypothetical protein